MPIFGPIIDEEQQARRRQALNQTIEERLGLGVDPMKVFAQHQEWLHLAFSKQQPLDPIESLLTALRRIKSLPLRIFHDDIQQPEQRRQRRLQIPVE